MNGLPFSGGVRMDCEELLRRFQATNTVRFEEFTRVWNEMKIGEILTTHENEKDLLQFMEECFLIALSFCRPIHQFQYRTGGLYLLYSFYFKQKCKFKLKIRVTLQQWKEFLEYIETVKEQEHHDIHFIFQTLRLKHAFHFVFYPKELAPFYRDIGSTELENSYTLHSSLKEFMEDGFLDQIEYLHEWYSKMKSEVITDGSLNIIQEDIVQTARKFWQEYETKHVAKLKPVIAAEAEMETDEKDTIGKRRSALKSGLYKNVAKAKKSRRHRVVELHDSKKEETASKIFKRIESNTLIDEDLVQPSCSNMTAVKELVDVVENVDGDNDAMDIVVQLDDDLSMPTFTKT